MIMTIERVLNLICLLSVEMSATESGVNSRRYYARHAQADHAVCLRVARRAHRQGLDSYEAVAVSQHETRHRAHLVGSSGERGPMQALPKYWSRKGDKDYIDAGLRAWRYYRSRSASTREAAGKFNGAGQRSKYARTIARNVRTLKDQTAWISPPPRM
jgi:hypothetical protein